MAYLLDANIFIQAHRLHYPFAVVPGFWRWLKVKNQEGLVHSIRTVFDQELKDGEDELADWAAVHQDTFFLVPDPATISAMKEVTRWVMQQDYTTAKRANFFAKADPWLVATAMAHDRTLVTAETKVPQNSKTPKIPNVCDAMDVKWINGFDLLREEKARFDWRDDPGE